MTCTELASPTRTAPGYSLDTSWYAERDRLESLTRLYDPTTLRLCRQLGLATGWHCLEVGAGTGSVARQLADHVGPAGSVLALDLDTRFLDPLPDDTLRVLQADVTTDPLPAAEFDLVHARLLLEHLPQRDHVLAALASALRPGGWLLVEDFDWVTADVVDPPSAVHRSVTSACLTLMGSHGYDPHYARTLPRVMREIELIDVGTHAESIQVTANSKDGLPQWELLVEQLTPGLLAAGLIDQVEIDGFHDLWHDGHTVGFAPIMISTSGRRPAVPSRDGRGVSHARA
jgi:ubiquinone/menaquinone biosynthesis C-methylase UbiE